MEIIIKGSPQEIAALVLAVQGWQDSKSNGETDSAEGITGVPFVHEFKTDAIPG